MVASGSLLALAMVNVLLFTLFRINSELKPEQASFGAESGDPSHPKPLQSGMWHNNHGHKKAFPWKQICVPSSTIKEDAGLVYDLTEAGSAGVSVVVMSQSGTNFFIDAQGGMQKIYFGSNLQDEDVILWNKMGKKRNVMRWTFKGSSSSCP